MLRLCLENIFNKKRTFIIILAILVLFVFTIFSSNFYMDSAFQYMNAQTLNDEFAGWSLLFLDIGIIILILLITLDHDDSFNLPYLVMAGRTKYFIQKTLSYIITSLFVTLIVIFGIIVFPGLLTKYFELSRILINHLLTLLLDSFIICGLSLLVVRSKKKYAVFLVLLATVFSKIGLFLYGNDLLFLYYLIPLTYSKQELINNYLLYKIFYIAGLYYGLFILSQVENH